MTLPVDARLVPRPNVAAREINDGAVLVNMGSGACFELNRIGFEIWKLLGSGSIEAQSRARHVYRGTPPPARAKHPAALRVPGKTRASHVAGVITGTTCRPLRR